MNSQSVATGETPLISIRASGDLRINGWERAEVSVEGDLGEDVRVQQDANGVQIVAQDDCQINIPMKSSLQIEKIDGDGVIKDLSGPLTIASVGGDLSIRRSGAIQVQRVGGDMAVKDVNGELEAQHLGGDATVKDIHGSARVATVGGDLYLENAGSGLQSTVGGDATISLNPQTGQEYNLRAGGDIHCRLPADANARLVLRSGGGDIQLRLGNRIEHLEARNYQVTLGQGGATITLMAGGDILLTSEALPSAEAGDIYADFAAELSSLGERISRKVTSKIEGADIPSKVNRVTEEALRRAQEQVRAAMRKLEESGVPPVPPIPPEPAPAPGAVNVEISTAQSEISHAPEAETATEPVSDDERLLVLRMLQDKKITAEEAEQLLEALDEQEAEQD